MATKRKELKRLNDIHENMLDKVAASFATQLACSQGPTCHSTAVLYYAH